MKNKIIKLMVILVIVLIIIDQVSKIIVVNKLGENHVGENNFLKLELSVNTGMALGFNNGSNNSNIVVTVFILMIIATFVKNQIERIDTKTAVSVSLLIAGGVSNLVDRIFRKGVIDFIKLFTITFNIADVCVVVGWILLVVFLIDYSRKN